MSGSSGHPDGGEARAVAPAPDPTSVAPPAAPAPAAGPASAGPSAAGSADASAGPLGVRASDADRQAMVDWLSRATGEGLISLEEFSTLSGEAYAARTQDELAAVGHQVQVPPAPPRAVPPEVLAAAPPKRRWVVGVMSGAVRKGRWSAARRTGAVAFWGSVVIDLRDALLEGDDIEITAIVAMGSISVIVPEGIPVESDGLVVMGGRCTRVKDVPLLPGAPTVRVNGYGFWGGIDVRSKPPRGDESDHASRTDHRHQHHIERLHAAREVLDSLPGAVPSSRPPAPPPPPPAPPASAPAPPPLPTVPGASPSAPAGPGPSPSPPGSTGDLVTVVCTDIVGSTRYADLLGDQRWREVLLDHNALVRRLLADHGGTEVKTVGDGFLLTFPSARSAIRFAGTLQDALAERRRTEPDTPLEVRIGVHAGEVERDGADVIGRNVTIACRLCDVAAAGEVLVSAVVADLADSASDLTFGAPREHRLAGIERPLTARTATRA